jgi:hypothetical protein
MNWFSCTHEGILRLLLCLFDFENITNHQPPEFPQGALCAHRASLMDITKSTATQ